MLLAPPAQHAQQINHGITVISPSKEHSSQSTGHILLRPHQSISGNDQPATCCLPCLAATGDSKARPCRPCLSPQCSV